MSQDRSGLSYKKIDLHVHTPASHDFINKDITEEDIINHCISIGLDAIAITDHNTGEYIDRLKEKANGKITIIPGVEITCTGGISGIHIIGLFDITKGTADINALLSRLDILPVNFGKQETITGKSVNDVINEISNMGGCISKSISIAYLLRAANASPLGGKCISGGVPGMESKRSVV